MKKLILTVLVAVILLSCKKNSSVDTDAQYALSKIIENGKLKYEYIFNSDGQLTETKWYKEDMGTTVLGGIEKYSYFEKGSLKESVSYSQPSNKVSTFAKYKVDATGRMTRSTYHHGAGADSGKVYLYIDHEYNKSGKISKQSWYSPDDKLTDYRKFSYYENGNMKSIDAFKVNGLSQEKFYTNSFGASDVTLPASLVRPFAIPVNYYIDYMVSGPVEQLSYKDDVLEYQSEIHMSERQPDMRGFVTKQKLTTKNILPAGSDEVVVLQLEFKKL